MAGPIEDAQDAGRGWRNWLEQNRDDIEWVNPEDLIEQDEFCEEYVEDEIELIKSSDAMLVHWEDVKTCGTPMEVVYAATLFDIPVIVQTTVEDPSKWLTYHATAIVDNFNDAIALLHATKITA